MAECVQGVSESRKISVQTLNSYADNFITLADPKDYVKYKLADKLIYSDEIKTEINKLLKKMLTQMSIP